MKKLNLGSSFDSWLHEEGIYEEVTAAASKRVLARQIEAGAPADLFISADQEWMDYLQARGRIRPDSRRDLVSNRLVLVAPDTERWAKVVKAANLKID